MPQLSLHTPLGALTISAEDDAVVALDWGWGRDQTPTALLRDACDQLHAYLDGERTAFDLPFRPNGSAYQRRVWDALRAIPYGETLSYGEVTRRIGRGPEEARAVGAAVGRTPVPIVVPCHRVIGADGSLTGYGGGLDRKRLLLGLESPVLSLL